jgi:hypothetical protein
VRSDHAIAFNSTVDLSSPTNSGGIGEEILVFLVEDDRIDRIPGGARHIADHHSILPQHSVHQCGFADIWPPHHGNAGHRRLFSILIRDREEWIDRIQKVGNADAMFSRDRIECIGTQLIEIRHERLDFGRVNLVDHDKQWLWRSAQETDYCLIRGRQPGPAIHQQDQNVRFGNGELRLTLDEGQHTF